MKRIIAIVIVAVTLASCGTNSTDEFVRFTELCHAKGGHVIHVHNFDTWTRTWSCFTGIELHVLDFEDD